MDYGLDNVLIDDDGPIVIDWNSYDLHKVFCWLLAASHTEETLAVEEDLKLYRDTLSSSGGPSWSLES